ncbi:MAG: DUF881 domain-containing protein [Mycobacteriales bacterium]
MPADETSTDETSTEDTPVTRRSHRLRAGALIGVLCALLGFGFAVQVHSQSGSSKYANAREEDLVTILDDLTAREQRLRQELGSLNQTRQQLSNGSGSALDEARRRADEMAILAGTEPATGPGMVLTIKPGGKPVKAEVILDAVEEMRGAGAEALQINSVRIGASTWFADGSGGGLVVDGTALDKPYTVTAIGDPATLAAAMNIPGGVVDSVHQAGGQVEVEQRKEVAVTAVRHDEPPQYAHPAH